MIRMNQKTADEIDKTLTFWQNQVEQDQGPDGLGKTDWSHHSFASGFCAALEWARTLEAVE